MLILDNIIEGEEQSDFRSFLEELRHQENPFLLRDQIIDSYRDYCSRHGKAADESTKSPTRKLIDLVQEIVFYDDLSYLVTRRRIGETAIYGVPRSANRYELVPVKSYLAARDAIILGCAREECNGLEIDMDPFITAPLIKDHRNIGKGIYYFLRYLSSQLFTNQAEFLSKLFDFLKVHQLAGTQLMLNPTVPSLAELEARLKDALEMLESYPPETTYAELKEKLGALGFECGWGCDAARIRSTMELLGSVMENPDHDVVGEFFSRIPMIHKIAVITPHGWFAQENVLGRPDTGGQVVYILNQVRALENELCRLIHDSGLQADPQILIVTRMIPEAEGTNCNVRMEAVEDTRFTQILRVPFRAHNKDITDKWISRFEIWPYLEEFALDAGKEVVDEMGGRPDLIVGNYTDGNIVAYLMSRDMGVTYCTIAHALEKAKYLYSDLNWKGMDDQYHFSLQFTADLIAMSAANITVTSSYQEIAGTSSTIGQYESYRFYNMPGLYRVRSGANMFHPRYNIVPPGVDQRFFYPYTKQEKRPAKLGETLAEHIFHGREDETSRFRLADPSKKPIYTIARLDHIKNITGLVEAFGKSDELREFCNLIVVSGHVDRAKSTDQEEQDQIDKMYSIVERYHLENSIRWLEMETDKNRVGEMYRLMADHRGIFVQPALFEAFGLTVLEAMISGLPTVATRYGGPLEIIENGESGYHINPNNHAEVAEIILPIVRGEGHEDRWERVSRGGVERVLEKYTWDLHAAELIKLAKIYGFWNFVSQDNTRPLKRYVDTLYQLLYRPMAAALLEKHGVRPAPHGAAVLSGQ